MRRIRNALLFVGSLIPTLAMAQDVRPLGFEDGGLGSLPQPWFVPPVMRGWSAALVAMPSPAGERCLLLQRGDDPDAAPTGNVMTGLPAGELAGRRVRLSARLRVEGGGHAQLWLRVDRAGGQVGAFDNMADRPVRGDRWQPATIELDVAADAQALALGVLAFGGAAVAIDAVELAVVGAAAPAQPPTPAEPLRDRELHNAVAASRLLGYLWFFHPSDALVALDRWDHFAVELVDAALPAADDAELVRRLGDLLLPFAPTVQLWAGDAAAAPPIPAVPDAATHRRYWEHRGAGRVAKAGNVYRSRVVRKRLERPIADDVVARASELVELADGVRARVPVELWGERTRALPSTALPAEWSDRARLELTADNRSTRLAAVAQVWNVMQHFYPYFDVVDVDWAAELPRALAAAATAADGEAAGDVLERLVAALHDGHGHVSRGGGMADSSERNGFLPFAVRWAGDDLVVTAVGDGVGGVAVGDVVDAIDGEPVVRVLSAMAERVSAATDGWLKSRSAPMLASWRTADPVRLALRRPDGTSASAELRRSALSVRDPGESRPPNGASLGHGIVYFDLDRAPTEELERHLDALRAARGIVFDLRGYPNSAATEVVRLLLKEPGQSARWGVPIVTRPDRSDWSWDENGRWQLAPREPRLDAEIAFLTDGRAISYAESIMGIVEAYRLGEIVGATTAGTNGNVNPFEVAGGFTIVWTGMRVRKHDGSRHHGVGIAPTVPVVPTAAGIAAGRDEVLERAVALLEQRLGR